MALSIVGKRSKPIGIENKAVIALLSDDSTTPTSYRIVEYHVPLTTEDEIAYLLGQGVTLAGAWAAGTPVEEPNILKLVRIRNIFNAANLPVALKAALVELTHIVGELELEGYDLL